MDCPCFISLMEWGTLVKGQSDHSYMGASSLLRAPQMKGSGI